MAKFCGKIGFETTKKTGVDVYEEEITEVKYFGDVIKNRGRITTGSEINSDVNISTLLDMWSGWVQNGELQMWRFNTQD